MLNDTDTIVYNMQKLVDQIGSICPITGVSMDGTIWYQDTATDEQKLKARELYTGFNFYAQIVPLQVTMYQARAALIEGGLFDQVNNAIHSLGANSLEFQAWEYATNFYRNSSFILSLSQQLGFTSDQVDQLFIAANKIT